MSAVYYDKLKRYFTTWRANTFANYAELLQSRKGRAIDKLVFATMSNEKFYLLMWVKYM